MSDALVRRFADALRAQLAGAPEPARRALLQRVAELAHEQVMEERQRCVDVCLRRGALWKASRADSPLAHEARARGNEALYLADLLETGEELPEIT